MIELRGLLCRLSRHHCLRVAALTLQTGQCWTLFGGNGAGKSALAAVISAQLPLGAAHVSYPEGFDPRRDIALVSFAAQQQLWLRDSRLDMSEYSASAHDPGTTVAALILAGQPPDARFELLVDSLGLAGLQQQGIRFLSSGR
jgi:molybdate transport system ATP-binding protein